MPTGSYRCFAVIAAALVFGAASCDKKGPTSPPAPTTGTSVVRLQLIAPAEIAPGETVQLTAEAVRSDGSIENVSTQARWSPATSEVLLVGPTGLATGKDRGEIMVSADFSGVSASARVLVLPKGTFRFSGELREGSLALENGTVTVMSGTGAGLTAVTNRIGVYVIYGLSGRVKLQAKKDGYRDGVLELNVVTHNERPHSLEMVASQLRDDYGGSYTLTISAQPVCPGVVGSFPEAARRRTYSAEVRQDTGGRLAVSLSGGDFIVYGGYGDDFSGRVTSFGEFTFYLGRDYYYPSMGEFHIAERFGDTALLVEGYATATGTPERISGTLSGKIIIAGAPSHPFTPLGPSCPTDRFEMVRR